jgi:hypothetical protein
VNFGKKTRTNETLAEHSAQMLSHAVFIKNGSDHGYADWRLTVNW